MARRPAINNPRSVELRELSAIVASIRERIVALEAAADSAGAGSASGTSTLASGSSAFLRSLNAEGNGLLAKVAANSVRSRSMAADDPFAFEEADGVGGNPRLTVLAQAASLVFASPMGYAGAPAFRVLELAGPDFARQGSLGTVLHGNEYGETFWSPVDLSLEVEGVLPVDHLAGTYDIDILGGAGRLTPTAVPASAAAQGEEGQVAWDASHLYICLGPYTWRRVALSSF